MPSRVRAADWLCALGAVALAVLLSIDDDRGWGEQGPVVLILIAVALAASAATVVLTATQPSPSAALAAGVAGAIWGSAAAVALLVEGHWPELAAAGVLVAGALLGLHDERMPGAVDPPVTRRPAPPAA